MPRWLIGLLILLAIYVAAVTCLILAGRKVAAKELALLVPNLVLLFRDLFRDPSVPRGPKVAIAVAIVWLVSPIDLLPEFLPVVGPLDDAVVAALVLRYLVRRSGPDIVRTHWRGDPATVETILRFSGVSDVTERPPTP
jgi:uncharacterized membrane protein YkvA (DUF1232 family)